ADGKLAAPAQHVQGILGWCRQHPSRSECTCLPSQRHHRLALQHHSTFSVVLPREPVTRHDLSLRVLRPAHVPSAQASARHAVALPGAGVDAYTARMRPVSGG
ncbi:MAG: hypothetical protein ACXWQZ_25190, partial [Ktedonobacterales bacterium]